MIEQNNKGKNLNSFVLRRRLGPIIGIPVIFCIPLVALILGSLRTDDFSWIKIVLPVFVILYGGMLFFQLGYKISLKDNKIIQRASGGKITTIDIQEIEKVARETSDLSTLLSFKRASSRITVYEKEKNIDISLKHFKSEDIRKIMRIIHEQRPDIFIPKGWI